jgi:putative restriction endonuclease
MAETGLCGFDGSMTSYRNLGFDWILDLFSDLRQAPTGTGRAPHKPLLILLMLGRYQRGLMGDVLFSEIREPLAALLEEFGPAIQGTPNVVDPFWRLQNDKGGRIWKIVSSSGGRVADSITPPPIGILTTTDARGNFAGELGRVLASEPAYVARLAGWLMDTHFPPSLHDEIRAAAGLTSVQHEPGTDRATEDATTPRDPGFRERVLVAYEYRCAVTGWDMRLNHRPAGIEAAHIRWHSHQGPSVEQNGLALTAVHHKLFDLGAFTLSLEPVPRILVSRLAVGNEAVRSMLLDHHGKLLCEPQDKNFLPHTDFIRWHQNNVFKGDARTLSA